MNLNQWFDKGLTPQEYMDKLKSQKDNFLSVYNNFTVPDGMIERVKNKNLRVVAIAKVWCAHCMFCVPILLRLAEKADIPVKILPRDENLDLMDHYLTNEKRIIPIFIFIDEDGNEVGNWGPMAEMTRAFVDEKKKDLPAKEADNYDEKFKVYAKELSHVFSQDSHIWAGTSNEIVQTIA